MTITGIDQSNAQASEFWAAHRRDDARAEWRDLSPEDQIAELRLWDRSEFFDQFEGDPVVVTECPDHGDQSITPEDTHCGECSRDLLNLPPEPFDNYRDWFA
ncbi:hypothetical protein [Microbacterium sp. KR10-403]|uniref:hypothetical protein n=1 Tax=Microbacterium sp. KR10-403 TaxID=3158581 RepID=UPI0032E4F93D